MGHALEHLHRPNLGTQRGLGAVPLFAVSTLTYGIALIVMGLSLWGIVDTPSWLSDASIAIGVASILATPIALIRRRWHVLAIGLAIAASASVVAGVLGTFEIIVAPAFEPNMSTWAMTLGMFSAMWGAAVYMARGVEKRDAERLAEA